jgi:ADP-ribosyl-[dinitrogen reductase] hydrolase
MSNSEIHDRIIGGLLGVAVGDALGVPVEFLTRETIAQNPVRDMIGFGTHRQPPGTWSDDSSLTFCLAESLCQGYDLNAISGRFQNWLYHGYWTASGRVFDVGNATREAIENLRFGKSPLESGLSHIRSNGNGSLMRILPLAFFLYTETDAQRRFQRIHEVSGITHAHPVSLIACGIYVHFAIELMRDSNPARAWETTRRIAVGHYAALPEFKPHLTPFRRLLAEEFARTPGREIQSSGYVVHTLEAAIWCLFQCDDYAKTVLLAVNLGEDTDTTGAVAGGLAGVVWGGRGIPEKWSGQLIRREDIEKLGRDLGEACLLHER